MSTDSLLRVWPFSNKGRSLLLEGRVSQPYACSQPAATLFWLHDVKDGCQVTCHDLSTPTPSQPPNRCTRHGSDINEAGKRWNLIRHFGPAASDSLAFVWGGAASIMHQLCTHSAAHLSTRIIGTNLPSCVNDRHNTPSWVATCLMKCYGVSYICYSPPISQVAFEQWRKDFEMNSGRTIWLFHWLFFHISIISMLFTRVQLMNMKALYQASQHICIMSQMLIKCYSRTCIKTITVASVIVIDKIFHFKTTFWYYILNIIYVFYVLNTTLKINLDVFLSVQFQYWIW